MGHDLFSICRPNATQALRVPENQRSRRRTGIGRGAVAAGSAMGTNSSAEDRVPQQGGDRAQHGPAGDPDSAADWRAAAMAIQLGLGLLPSGGIGLIVLVLIVLLLMGRI
jgi:hypothetical protein